MFSRSLVPDSTVALVHMTACRFCGGGDVVGAPWRNCARAAACVAAAAVVGVFPQHSCALAGRLWGTASYGTADLPHPFF